MSHVQRQKRPCMHAKSGLSKKEFIKYAERAVFSCKETFDYVTCCICRDDLFTASDLIPHFRCRLKPCERSINNSSADNAESRFEDDGHQTEWPSLRNNHGMTSSEDASNRHVINKRQRSDLHGNKSLQASAVAAYDEEIDHSDLGEDMEEGDFYAASPEEQEEPLDDGVYTNAYFKCKMCSMMSKYDRNATRHVMVQHSVLKDLASQFVEMVTIVPHGRSLVRSRPNSENVESDVSRKRQRHYAAEDGVVKCNVSTHRKLKDQYHQLLQCIQSLTEKYNEAKTICDNVVS